MASRMSPARISPAIDGLSGLLVIAIWGFNFVVVKAGTQEFPPLLLTGLRFSAVALLLAPFYRLPRYQWALVLLLSSLMGGLHFGLFFVSVAGLDVPTAAIVSQLAVPFSAMVAAVAYSERLGRKGLIGMALSFAGVLLVVGEPGRSDPLSLALAIVSAMAWALSMAVIKRIGPINPLALNGWMSALAAPQLILLSFFFERDQAVALHQAGWMGWGAVAYTALLATMTGYTLWYRLLARYPINRIVPLTLLSPIVAVISGIAVFGGSLGWPKVAGGAVTLIGVAVLQFRLPSRRAASPKL